jgi:hypothetical protein
MLPIRDSKTEQLMTNFEMLYNAITYNIALHSDPGVYICSTDMTLIIPKDGRKFNNFSKLIKNSFFLKKFYQYAIIQYVFYHVWSIMTWYLSMEYMITAKKMERYIFYIIKLQIIDTTNLEIR